jgi:transcriptional regulator with XRE-family HTH domain
MLKPLSVQFGITVRRLRQEKGFAHEEFAYHCGINRTYMTDVELGRRSPTIDICRRICRGLGIELSAFFIALESDGYTVLQDDGTSSE